MDIKQISLPCDIVLLPASDLAQKALAISRELQQYGGLFSLNDNGTCIREIARFELRGDA